MTTTPDTTIDTTIDATVTATLAELQVELDVLGSAGDCSSYNQLAAYEARQSSIMGAMRTLRESRTILAEITPQLHALEKWHGHLLGWRALLITQLEATAPTDPRAYGIQLSIRRINVGLDLINEAHPGRMVLDDLMASEGYVPSSTVARAHGDQWYGCLPQVEAKLRELRPRAADARERRDAILAERDARRDARRDIQRTG